MTIILLVIVGLYTVGTVQRNSIWKDNISLWSDTVQKSPDSAGVHNDLGFAYASKGQLDMAIAEYQTALRPKPDSAEGHNKQPSLSGIYFLDQKFREDCISGETREKTKDAGFKRNGDNEL